MQPRDLNQREADALASMMGADSRRIDDLVGDVGAIKGDVRTLTAESIRIGSGSSADPHIIEPLQAFGIVL